MNTLERFYTAFQQHDWKTMGDCYHEHATFSDPVFPDLDAEQTGAMWKMLLSGGTDLRITFEVLEETANTGKVRWQAWYTFSKTKRPVHNIVSSTFVLKDGLIMEQKDVFDFWRWSRQALGTTGWLLGWSPIVRDKVRGIATNNLNKTLATRS